MNNDNGEEAPRIVMVDRRQQRVRVCSRSNKTISFQHNFKPGALDLDIPIEQQEARTSPDGFIEHQGIATFASFTQIFVTEGDLLFVRISGLPRGNRLISPCFLFVSQYDAPALEIVYESADGPQAPIVVYNEADVAARRLVVSKLDAGVLGIDLNFSTDAFSWERGINITRTAVVTLVIIDPPAFGPGLTVIYLTKLFEGSATNGIIIGVIFIFIAACCTPCILIYIFACFALCCCGKERYNKIIASSFGAIKSGGINTEDDPSAPPPGCCARTFACLDRNVAIAIVGATVASAIFTIVQLVALIFNIVLIQQGIEFFNELLPQLPALVLELFNEWALDLGPLVDGISKITEAFQYALLSVSVYCFSARNILAAAICVWMFQFIVIALRLDALVRVRHIVARVSGPIFEMIGGVLLTVLALGMQSALQQTNVLLSRFVRGDITSYDAVGCTDLDEELLPITRPGTVVFIVAVTIALVVGFLYPRDKQVWRDLPSTWSVFQKGAYMLFGAVAMLVLTMLGVWTNWAIKYSGLHKRARSGVKMFNADLGTAYGETIDAVSRLSGMFFILFWPPLIIISKIGDASAEAPIWVADRAIVDLIDPAWQRIIIWITNMIAFALQIVAVVAPSADALVAAAALIVAREMVLKLIITIVKIVRAEPPGAVGSVGGAGGAGGAAAAPTSGSANANSQSDMESARFSGIQLSTRTGDSGADNSSVTVVAPADTTASTPAAPAAPGAPAPAPTDVAPTPPAAAQPATTAAADDEAEVASVSAEPDPVPESDDTPPAAEPQAPVEISDDEKSK